MQFKFLPKKILLQLCQSCCKLGASLYYPITRIAILSYNFVIVKNVHAQVLFY
jgi:hypothetical protein